MRLKLPANSFLVVGEREKGNVCVNSKCTSFASVCDMKLSKMLDDYETLVLAIFTANLLVCPHSGSSFLSRYFSSTL